MGQREIKFRCWNPIAKIMVYKPERLALSIGEQIDINNIFSDSVPPLNSEKMEWMQFTGLLDRNWKEIFESDIVRHIIHCKIVKLVRYVHCYWQPFTGFGIPDGIEKWEIIGNVFEDKKLLTQEK